MAAVVRDKTMKVSQQALFAAITDFEHYPKFLPEVVSSKAQATKSLGVVRVTFEIEVVKRFEYVLEFKIEGADLVSWKLVESNFFKTNQGKWQLKSVAAKATEVHYELEVAFGFMVPGFVTKKLTEINLPKMFESFETRAKSLEA